MQRACRKSALWDEESQSCRPCEDIPLSTLRKIAETLSLPEAHGLQEEEKGLLCNLILQKIADLNQLQENKGETDLTDLMEYVEESLQPFDIIDSDYEAAEDLIREKRLSFAGNIFPAEAVELVLGDVRRKKIEKLATNNVEQFGDFVRALFILEDKKIRKLQDVLRLELRAADIVEELPVADKQRFVDAFFTPVNRMFHAIHFPDLQNYIFEGREILLDLNHMIRYPDKYSDSQRFNLFQTILPYYQQLQRSVQQLEITANFAEDVVENR